MSYSIGVRAASKALVLAALAAEFDKVVAGQPIHARDREQALGAAGAMVGTLDDDESQDVSVSMSGWLSGAWSSDPDASQEVSIRGASVTVSASLNARPVEAS